MASTIANNNTLSPSSQPASLSSTSPKSGLSAASLANASEPNSSTSNPQHASVGTFSPRSNGGFSPVSVVLDRSQQRKKRSFDFFSIIRTARHHQALSHSVKQTRLDKHSHSHLQNRQRAMVQLCRFQIRHRKMLQVSPSTTQPRAMCQASPLITQP